jgi:RHS repeat-associated protein
MRQTLIPIILTSALALPAAASTWTMGTYVYDSSGNVVRIGDDQYVYDRLGRLTKGTATGTSRGQEYTYDSFGNRLSAGTCVNGACTPAQIPVTATTNHVQGAGYGDAGNLESSPSGEHYVFDATEMISSRTAGNESREYIYTADDQRIAVHKGEEWHWSVRDLGQRVARDFTSKDATSSWTVVEDYVHTDRGLTGSISAQGRRHVHLDHLGTPRLITAEDGHRVGVHAYYPFGEEPALASESPQERMKFTGHERDDSGLDYMHARYYGPVDGRFLSVDRAQGRPGVPQSWNRYSYARNNPVLTFDPDGNANVDFYVLMNPAKADANYDRQWFAARLSDQYGNVGHTLTVSTSNASAITDLGNSFGCEGAMVGYFGHSEGIQQSGNGYAAAGLNPRSVPKEIGIANQDLVTMINKGSAAIALIAACSSDGCFAGGGLNGKTTVVALRSPTGLTDAITLTGAVEAFNNAVVSGNGTVADGVAAANRVFKKYKMKDQFVVVDGDPQRRLDKD